MEKSNRGGPRPNSGRPKTGDKTRCFTVTLPVELADQLEKQANENNMSINKYLRHLIEISGQYGNVNLSGSYVDEDLLAAEDVTPYAVGKKS